MALAAAAGLYREFNPLLSLKALTYYGEPSLKALPAAVREVLMRESAKVELVKPLEKLASTISVARAD
jgi:hypothetical protein